MAGFAKKVPKTTIKRREWIAKGRGAETHSVDGVFKKVGREPNRFEAGFEMKSQKV